VQSIHDAGLYVLHARWAGVAVSFERAQLAARIAPGTARLLLQHLRRFGATIDAQPWHVGSLSAISGLSFRPVSTRESTRGSELALNTPTGEAWNGALTRFF
jgi:hypothetical protein